MIAIDMDGTLLGDEGRVSSRNLAALSSALSAGIEVVAIKDVTPLPHNGCRPKKRRRG